MAVATPVDNVVVRLATEQDYEAVLAIDRTIYEGFDVVPALYHKYLADPRRMVFVMEVEKKIVAFTMYQIVDDGKTAVAQAARMNPSLRSSGIYNHIGNQAFDMMRNRYPDVERVSLTSAYKQLLLAKIRSGTWKVDFVLERPFIDGRVKLGQYETLKKFSVSPTVQRVDAMKARSILLDPENQWKLFPQRRIVFCTEVFQLLPSNMDLIVLPCEVFLCSKQPGSNTNSCSTLSLGTHFKTKVGIRYNIDIYSLNVKEAFDHIVYQLQLALKYYTEGMLCFWICFPASFPRDEIRDHLIKHLPVEETKFLAKLGDSACLFEQDLMVHSSLRTDAAKL